MRRLALAPLALLLACGDGDDSVFEQRDGGPVRDAGHYDGGGRDGGVRDAGPDDRDAGPRDGGERDGGTAREPCDPGFTGTDEDRYRDLLICLRDTAPDETTKRAAIDEFVFAIEASGGFPIRTETGAIFVYVRDARFDAEDDKNTAEDFAAVLRQTPISVAGDHNMWQPGTDVMTDEGLDFFHAEIPIPTAVVERARYKFVAKDDVDDDVWFSDPLSRRFDYDPAGRISIVLGGRTQGHIEWLRDVHATMLNVDRTIYVYVPPSYDQNDGERYAVLYMQDGNNLFDLAQPASAPVGTWDVDAVFEAELSAGNIRPGLIVGIPNNANRFGEYTHIPDDLGNGNVGGDADLYAHFVVEELKPMIDMRYRTFRDRANTGVLGSSLGGLASFHIGRLYPNEVRFVGGMSSTFIWGRFGGMGPTMVEQYADTADLGMRNQIFYLDSGGNQGPGCMSGGGLDNYCETIEMRQTLVAAGLNVFPDDPDAVPLTPEDANIYHYWERDAPHSEGAWNARLFRPLRFFFRR